MKEIYLDNAAATRIDPGVIRAMQASFREPGNPSAFNTAGRRARAILDGARGQIAQFLHARSQEIVFCASGSEANTLAIRGVLTSKTGHVVTTPIEHPSALEPIRHSGNAVTYVSVDSEGRVRAEDIAKAITPRTTLVSVMYVNNEIGSIQPIKKISALIRRWRKDHRTDTPYFHVDACQATAWLPMDVQALGVDLLTLNGAKVHGPHGSAVLFVRRGVVLAGQVLGGKQEHGLRAGTEDVASAVGLAAAVERIHPSDVQRVRVLRDRLIEGFRQAIPDARLNGPTGDARLANTVHISVPDADSERILLELDRRGIYAGAGSACTAHAVEPSPVLRAIGVPRKYLSGALRFSLSRSTTKSDIDRVVRVLPNVIRATRLRNT